MVGTSVEAQFSSHVACFLPRPVNRDAVIVDLDLRRERERERERKKTDENIEKA